MSHNRRQSGLWERNEDGFFEQSPLPSAKIAVSGAYLPDSSPPSNGPYSYYQPPPPQSQEKRRTFSDRSTGDNQEGTPEKMVTSSTRPPLTIDPDYTPPSNLRSKAWSPEPTVVTKGRQVSNASNTSEGIVRRGSVPDRSPLQNLETWSKEEKRARAEQAEGRVRKGSGSGSGSQGKRVVSSPMAVNNARKENVPRNVSGPSKLSYRKEVGSGQKPNQAKPLDRGPPPEQKQQQQQQPVKYSTDLARNGSGSGTYKRRTRDAGFAGAAEAAATGPTIAAYDAAAGRGKAAYERRKSQQSPADTNGAYHTAGEGKSPFLPKEQLKTPKDVPVNYTVPPRTAAAQQAHEQVGFGPDTKQHHHFGGIFHRGGHEHRTYQRADKPLEDWRQARTGKLTTDDLDLEAAVKAAQKVPKPADVATDAAWWEKDQKSRRASGSTSTAKPRANIPQFDGPYEETANGFQPRLFLKCGPLLRYTGMRRESARDGGEKETWRGSVMILTEDAHSDLSSIPVLRMFRQDMDLHVPPPRHVVESGNVPPDAEDPIAGQVKLSRTGRALYVRPVHDIDGEVDLSRKENNSGLFSATRTSMLGPQGGSNNPAGPRPSIKFQNKSRIRARDGETLGQYREVKATRLHSERGHTFWRFNLEVELASVQARIAYRINSGPAVSFWVPARGETMNVLFHSCNGFSMSVDSHTFSGPDPLWRDVLNRHQAKPFHVMLGGGDQIYNDAVMRDTVVFKEWLQEKDHGRKHEADFSEAMQGELEDFYLERYAMWFSQGLFGMAGGSVPMVNVWDDHDIIDGFGSYPHHFQASPVFTGLGAIAHKYYMLFQHQSLATETEKDEPSWLLGQSPGPYINEVSRNIFLSLGKKMAFLGLDCRTERMRDEILSQETYDLVFDRCRREIIKGETKHLLVLLGVPIAYPRLNFLENILTSRMMDPIKALGRTGMLGGFVNKFDGGVEILDDLDDHWTAKHHKAERNWFIQELQELAAEKSCRITILGGDVHLAAVGQFFSKKDLGIAKDRDHRYMPNVISSAIVNTPPPVVMADVLNKRNKIHHLDGETDEDMIRIFGEDVDGSKRNNNCLLPRRNFCVLTEYTPGMTPPGTPTNEVGGGGDGEAMRGRDRRFPPGSMKRTMSLTRGPAALVRRLSGSSKRRPSISRPSMDEAQNRPVFDGIQRANSLGSHPPDGYGFPPRHQPAPVPQQMQMERRPSYHRRPTDLSEKAARKAAAKIGEEGNLDGRAPGEISLEGGLDVCLCVERDQKDPAGTTVGYRLLVPALWYEGTPDKNLARFSSHRKSLLERLKFNRKREASVGGAERGEQEEWSGSEDGGDGHVAMQHQGVKREAQAPAKGQQFAQSQGQQYAQLQGQQWDTSQPQGQMNTLLQQQQQQAQGWGNARPQSYRPQNPQYPQHAQPQGQQYDQVPTQQYPQQQPPSATQRSVRNNSTNSTSNAAETLGLSSTGRGAITALPKRTASGNAGYAATATTVVPTRSASSTNGKVQRASMDGYARPGRQDLIDDSEHDGDHGDAFTKGFHGSGPPIGGGGYATALPVNSGGAVARGPGAGVVQFPKSGYRRASGQQQQQQQQHHVLPAQDISNQRGGPVRRNTGNGLPLSSVPRDGEEDDGGYSSFSEEEREYSSPPIAKGSDRRGSSNAKAERFFGIGDGEEGSGRKKGWMIWK